MISRELAVTGRPSRTTLGQLKEVGRTPALTERIWSVCFSERLAVHAAARAADPARPNRPYTLPLRLIPAS